MTSRARAAFGPLLGAGVALVVAACSTSSGPALGGPHGGNSTFDLGPQPGNAAVVDAAYEIPDPPPTPGQMLGGPPGTWSHIFYTYLAKGTVGNCTSCHPQMSDPKKSYRYLDDQGFLGGANPALVQEGTSCLSWFGGDMPLNLKQSKAAQDEMTMWGHAGGLNN
jgi:hypothetical protein